jgi:5-methylcytosine-specific restriction endonuclease McrA
MRLFFVNTDAVSYGGLSKHDDWIRQNVVLTGGETGYKDALARIPQGARVLVYVNKVGVVAVGQVTTSETIEVSPPNAIYPTDEPEYHRPVAWLLDLRSNPITWAELVELLGQGPLQAVQEVHAGKDALLLRLALLEAAPTTDAGTYLRVAAKLRRHGPVTKPVGTTHPNRITSPGTQYFRDPKVRAWTLQRAQGHCELCAQPAPFVDEYQDPYLESHHITMLAEGGADTPENTAALCPTCHRELHFGAERVAKSDMLRARIAANEVGTHVKSRVAGGASPRRPGVTSGRMNITDLDHRLRDATRSDPRARPFVCDGSPLDCQVFIVGFNPASDVPFWPFWKPPYGFAKREWEAQYLETKGSYSPTRLRINRLVNALGSSIRCLETNMHSYASPDAASLPAAHRSTDVLQLLFDATSPKVAIFHGKEATSFAASACLAADCERVTGKHLCLWSYEAVDRLAEQVRRLLQSDAQPVDASDPLPRAGAL